MNRLWVRISLTFITIMIFVIMIPMLVIFAYYILDPAIEGQIRARVVEMVSTMSGTGVLSRFVRFLILSSLLGTLAGVISSRSLLAPLSELADAAQAIGSRDLSQRLEIKGTIEVQEVVEAFNTMAAELEQAEHLRRNMLADVAHELRTPISVIQGNLRAILDGVYEMDRVELARLYDQTRQLSRLVDDLHELAQAEANLLMLEAQEVDLSELVKNQALVYQPLLEKDHITLQLNIPEQGPVVRGDQARLTQCISNLINNAVRYTPAGGVITIEVSEAEDWITLTVRDTGIGIDQEHLPYIFDRFYRVDPARTRETGGTGLGLAITEALVSAHGGRISAWSDGQGQGSKFILQLPAELGSEDFPDTPADGKGPRVGN